jgi:hypothetical protein
MTTPKPTEAQLVRTIKVHIEKGDKAKDKAEQHYIAAGQYLKQLKDDCPDQQTFLEKVEKEIGLGKSRTYELLQIGDGRKTVAEIRADTAKRVARHEQSCPLASGQNADEFAKVIEAERELDQWQQEHPNAGAAQQPAKPAELDDAHGAAHDAAVKTLEAFWAAEEIDLTELGPDGCKYIREPVDRTARAWALLRADIQAVLQAKPDADPQWWAASGCPYCGNTKPELVPIRSAATDAMRREPKAATPPPQDDGLDIPECLRREPKAAAS